MLEQLRRQSGSFIIWFIFAIIIAAFVLFFGPQASGELGCGSGGDDFIVDVDNKPMDIHDWRFAMNSQRGGVPVAQRQTLALDALVGRTLLANAAREAGFDVSEEHVVENLKRGILYILGVRLSQQTVFESGVFDFEKLELIARNRGLPSVDYLIRQQKEEILANMMRTLLVQTPVSREEAEQAFIQQNTTVTAKYAKFDITKYRQAMTVTDADIQRYLSSNEDEIKKLYEARKASYQSVRPQVRVRHIMVKKDPNDAAAADAKATAIKTRLDKGEDFDLIAKELSEDDRTKNRGGDLGWRPVDSIGYGKELSEAAKALEEGKASDRIDTGTTVHFLRIDGKREGKLEFDAVKLELADDKARSYFAKEAARRDAQAALAKVEAGESFETLFPAGSEPGGATPPPGMLAPPNPEGDKPKGDKPEGDKPKDDKPEGDKTGMVFRKTETILASWGPVGQNAPAAAADKKEAPVAADKEPAPKEDPGKPAAVIDLPAYQVDPPQLATLGPTARQGEVLPGLGRAPELADALFGELEIGKPTTKVYEVGGGFVIARLDGKQNADLDTFDGKQVTIGQDIEECSFPLQMVAVTGSSDSLPAQCMSLKKGIDNLQRFLFDECSEAAQAGRIRVNSQFLSAESGEFKYSPCGSLDFNAALVQVLSLSSGL